MELLNRYFKKIPEEKRSSAAIAYLASLDHLAATSPLVAKKIIDELEAQRTSLKMIASENYSSLATQLTMGNLLTDKYAEGYPYHRFYAGCDNIDAVEERAAEELKEIFGADHAYVQPHSGADANLVAFWAIITHKVQDPEVEKLGKKNINQLTPEEHEKVRQLMVSQKVLGMSLNAGGHLTHGYRLNVSSKMMHAENYDVDPETNLLDYDAIEKQAEEFRPLILLAGFSAYPRNVNFARMREIADRVGAVLMVDMAHISGLVAGKVLQGDYDPVKHAHIVTSTTHKTLRGPRGGMVLCTDEFADAVNRGCPMILGGPLPHVMAAKAVAFKEANSSAFQAYAHQIVANSKALANALTKHGIKLVTGGSDNHLMIIDCVDSFGVTGRIAEKVLSSVGITVNRNTVPFDKMGPWYTSGIRIGTPALTTRGLCEKEMETVADLIVLTLKNTRPEIGEDGKEHRAKYTIDLDVANEVKERKDALLSQFPLYPELILTSEK